MAHFNYNVTTFSGGLSPVFLALLCHFAPSLTERSGFCGLPTLQGCRVVNGGQEGAGVTWGAGGRYKPACDPCRNRGWGFNLSHPKSSELLFWQAHVLL